MTTPWNQRPSRSLLGKPAKYEVSRLEDGTWSPWEPTPRATLRRILGDARTDEVAAGAVLEARDGQRRFRRRG